MLDIRKFPGRNLDMMIAASMGLMETAVCLLTLGFWRPYMEMTYVTWRQQKWIKYLERFEGSNGDGISWLG